MNLSEDFPQLVFGYDVELLREFIRRLKTYRYEDIQFIPAARSWLAFIKEHRNLLNLFLRQDHLLFYPSIFPRLYEWYCALKSRELHTCLEACFLNRWVPQAQLRLCFGADLIERALQNRILLKRDGQLQFSLRFVPFKDAILLSDPHYTYPPYNDGRRKFKDRIWMGADSIIFASFLSKFLKGQTFTSALEVGSGSGIAILTAAKQIQKCLAIDCNERAVHFTKLNAALNGVKHLDTHYSDLFEHVDDRFDLIIANPWYCDLATGGLEEAPGLVAGLKNHLRDGGVCVMLMNSYIKNSKDTVFEFLKDFIQREKYDLEIHTMGYNYDFNRASDLRRHGIRFSVYSHMILKKNGQGAIRKYDPTWPRWLRDRTYIEVRRTLHGWSECLAGLMRSRL